MKKHFALIVALTLLLILALAAPALAQEELPEMEIRLNRDFGYGGFGNDIQGTFSIRVTSPDDLQQVQFFVDDILLGTDTEAPFRIQFNTDSFDPGLHQISARGTLADGTELHSNQIAAEFLSSDAAMSGTLDLLIPILGITALITIGVVVLPMLTGRKGKIGPIGEYGPAGGTVCPRCGFPFTRRVLSPNLMVGKLERCPHCGKVSVRPRASLADLAAAEEHLRASRQEGGQGKVDPDESLQRALDESRFEE